MKFKIDTKEKFTVITPIEEDLPATLTAELSDVANSVFASSPKNVVLNLSQIKTIDAASASLLASLQQRFYENNASLVICEVKPIVEQVFEKADLLEFMNITPTESEAWDIVQMEEIERELLDDEDNTTNL